MFGNLLCNSAWEPDLFGSGVLTQGKAERPDMSRLGAGYVQENSLELG
jgi:hypothetical protein